MSTSGHDQLRPRPAPRGVSRIAQVLVLITLFLVTKLTRVEAQGQQAQPAVVLEGPCRAVLVQPASEELGLRIVGQSQDVACELEVVAAGEGVGCAELAARHGAHAVLSVRSPAVAGSAYEVVVCDALAETEQLRAVPIEHATGDALGASAAYEAVALVVRSALVDAATEHEARRVRSDQRRLEQQRAREAAEADAARARAAEARATAEADEEQDEESVHAAARAPDWLIVAGAELAAIGADGPAVGVTARALSALGAVQLGVGFSYGLPATRRDDSVELSLARHSGVLIASLPFALSSRATLDAGVQAGITALTRSTRARDVTVAPATDATHWSALLGAEVGAALRLAGPLGARVHAALDVVPGAPRYAYEDVAAAGGAGARTEVAPPAYLQPRAGIALFLAL